MVYICIVLFIIVQTLVNPANTQWAKFSNMVSLLEKYTESTKANM